MPEDDELPGQKKLREIEEASKKGEFLRVYELFLSMSYSTPDELGEAGMASYTQDFLRGRELYLKKESDSVANLEGYRTLARAALTRFSELQSGEHITTSELRKKLGEIRRAGKSVGYEGIPEGYSHLQHEELWRVLGRVRSDVRGLVSRVNSDIVSEIDTSNARQQELARLGR